ncbi:MAG TPA: TMEM175 family protein [Saprospiraceae bacterium]|nr:TMEM175 family protein [Saprospiraceae bacterium]
MNKNRLEAFSDGVLAIIITIMILEIKIPHSDDWAELHDLWPKFLSYIFSFTFVGIYWGNHHHLLHTVKRVSSGIIWSNMNLLFWLSLIPFATGWMGETHFSQNTVITYAVLLMICGTSYYILHKVIQANHKADENMKKMHISQERKGLASLVLYSLSIVFAFYNTAISGGLFVVVAAMWLVPDRNIERMLEGEH